MTKETSVAIAPQQHKFYSHLTCLKKLSPLIKRIGSVLNPFYGRRKWRVLEAAIENQSFILGVAEKRSRTLEYQLELALSAINDQNQRMMVFMEKYPFQHNIEHILSEFNDKNKKSTVLHNQNFILDIIEQRTRTLEYQLELALSAINYQNSFALKWYLEVTSELFKQTNTICLEETEKLILKSEHPIALNSNDYINPESTIEGVVRPTYFVKHCIEVLGSKIKLLDLGTGSGGLVLESLTQGLFAVGIDGSDFCAKYGVGYWPLLKNHLYNCDITRPFIFQNPNTHAKVFFDIITIWEVLEHINENELDTLFKNILDNLAPNGYFVGSISQLEYCDNDGTPYHVTIQSKAWWKDKFRLNGLQIMDSHPFNEHFFCRGVGKSFQDYHNYFSEPENGFHFVAQKLNESIPQD